MNPDLTLEPVRAIQDPVARATAATEYLERLAVFRGDAIAVRDLALRDAPGGPSELARAVGVSVSTVKLARRTRGAS